MKISAHLSVDDLVRPSAVLRSHDATWIVELSGPDLVAELTAAEVDRIAASWTALATYVHERESAIEAMEARVRQRAAERLSRALSEVVVDGRPVIAAAITDVDLTAV